MILFFLGPPGSGKGTQAKILSDKLNIPHLSTGDILRYEIKQKTSLGLKTEQYLNSGKLVPDNLMINLIEQTILKESCKKGFILDGFPRTVSQAQAIDSLFEKNKMEILKVMYFNIDKNILIERLSGRYVNPKTGAVYHKKYNPPDNEGICDLDGTKLVRRPDDEPERIETRLIAFEKETLPLIDFYKNKNKLLIINADNSIDKVSKKLENYIN